MTTDLDRLKAWMDTNGHDLASLRSAIGWRYNLRQTFRYHNGVPPGVMLRFRDAFGDETFHEVFPQADERTLAIYAAMIAVAVAVRRGILPKIGKCSCHNCGKQANSYHHPSYHKDDRLFVVPLCDKCHQRHHKSGMSLSPVRIAIAGLP